MRLNRVIHFDGIEPNGFFFRIKKSTEGIIFYGNNKQYFNNGIRFGYEEWVNDKRFYI